MRGVHDSAISIQSPYGSIFYFSFDRPIGEALALYGQWAMAEIQFARQFLNPGDTVIDGGANVGTHTLAFADACGAAGRVIAIEASPDVALLLQRTISANDLRTVELVVAALGEAEGTCSFARLSDQEFQNVGMLRVVGELESKDASIEVPVVTIDSFDLEKLRLIKLDIEGQELAALKGSVCTIERLRPIIMVELLNLQASIPIFDMLVARNYASFFCSFAVFDPSNYRGERENVFGVAREASLLFMPNEKIPSSTPDVIVTAIENIDHLAQMLSEMPRFGDQTDHDRIVQQLIQDRAELRLSLEAHNLPKPAEQESQMPNESLGSAELLRLITLEEKIDVLRSIVLQKADVLTVSAVQTDLREAWKVLDRAVFQDELGQVSEQAVEAAHRIRLELIASIETSHAKYETFKNEIESRAGDDRKLCSDALDAQRTNAEEISSSQGAQLNELRQAQHAQDGNSVQSMVRLKGELASLREALLGRSEDRTKFVLLVEAVQSKMDAILARDGNNLTDHQLMHDSLDKFRRESELYYESLSISSQSRLEQEEEERRALRDGNERLGSEVEALRGEMQEARARVSQMRRELISIVDSRSFWRRVGKLSTGQKRASEIEEGARPQDHVRLVEAVFFAILHRLPEQEAVSLYLTVLAKPNGRFRVWKAIAGSHENRIRSGWMLRSIRGYLTAMSPSRTRG